jgi:hypothetical protein
VSAAAKQAPQADAASPQPTQPPSRKGRKSAKSASKAAAPAEATGDQQIAAQAAGHTDHTGMAGQTHKKKGKKAAKPSKDSAKHSTANAQQSDALRPQSSAGAALVQTHQLAPAVRSPDQCKQGRAEESVDQPEVSARPQYTAEQLLRTVFVGNVAVTGGQQQAKQSLKKQFQQCALRPVLQHHES